MLAPESTPIEPYLRATPIVDANHPDIVSMGLSLTESAESETEKVRRLFEWVRDEITHSRDASLNVVTCAAAEVLQSRTGLCYAKAHLLAALLRSIGIPCGFCYQTFDADGSLHGLNGIYLSEAKKWIRLDPRGNTSGAARPARFDLSEERNRLAFPADPFLDDCVYAEPLPHIVQALHSHRALVSLWNRLPKAASDLPVKD